MAIKERFMLLCDDVRREDNQKLILIGMYVADMNVSQLPIVLPSLTFFCLLDSDRPGTFTVSFRLQHQETGQVIAQGMGQMAVGDHSQPVVFVNKMVNVQIRAEGLYVFSLEFEGQSPILKTFNIRLMVLGAAPQQMMPPHYQR